MNSLHGGNSVSSPKETKMVVQYKIKQWEQHAKIGQTTQEQWKSVENIMKEEGLFYQFIMTVEENEGENLETMIEKIIKKLNDQIIAQETKEEAQKALQKQREDEELQAMREEYKKRQKYKETISQRRIKRCSNCGRYGHNKYECRSNEQGKVRGGERRKNTPVATSNKNTSIYKSTNIKKGSTEKKEIIEEVKKKKTAEKKKNKNKEEPQAITKEEKIIKKRKPNPDQTMDCRENKKKLGGSDENTGIWKKIMRDKNHKDLELHEILNTIKQEVKKIIKF